MGKFLSLYPEVTTVGRGRGVEIVLADPTVSRQHAKIRREPDALGEAHYYIYDLGSVNGTYVNEEQIFKQELRDGFEVRLGEMAFVFKEVSGLTSSHR